MQFQSLAKLPEKRGLKMEKEEEFICPICHAKLVEKDGKCIVAVEFNCPSCGARCRPEDEYCKNCGSSIEVQVAPQPDGKYSCVYIFGRKKIGVKK